MVSNVPMMNYGTSGMGALSDDFMYNAYKNQTQMPTQGQVNFQGTQQNNKNGIGLGTLLLGGGAGAAAGYFLDSNPLKDTKHFKNSFINSFSKNADKANKYVKYFDKEAKVFTKEAPSLFNKALKNFKWKQAGKWGAIAAGGLIALDWLSGKFKGQTKQV